VDITLFEYDHAKLVENEHPIPAQPHVIEESWPDRQNWQRCSPATAAA
jgi:hypothetical protein